MSVTSVDGREYGEPLSDARTTQSTFSTAVALFLGHPFLETLNPLLGRLFDEGHVLGEMLLGVDLSFIAPFLLIEPKLRDDPPVFLVEFIPDLGTA